MKSNLALVKIIMFYYVIIILNKYTELKIILHNDTRPIPEPRPIPEERRF